MIQIKCKDNSLSFHDLIMIVVIVIVVVILKLMVRSPFFFFRHSRSSSWLLRHHFAIMMSLYLLLLILIGAFNSTTFVSFWNRLFRWQNNGSAGPDVRWSTVPSWSEWPEALAMQKFYAPFILLSHWSHSFLYQFFLSLLCLGSWRCMRTLMQCFVCNLNGFVKKNLLLLISICLAHWLYCLIRVLCSLTLIV